jgi:hypothetical protein
MSKLLSYGSEFSADLLSANGDTFYIDEVFARVPYDKINGKQHYLCRVPGIRPN